MDKRVGKLTVSAFFRHIFVGNLLQIGLLSCVPVAATSADEQAWQSVGSIAIAAEDFLGRKVGKGDRRAAVEAGQLDPRHRLKKCDRPLQAFLRPGTRIKSTTVVGVRCAGTSQWKVYLPVEVIVTDTVLVARRTLPRGHLISKQDLSTEERNVSRLIAGYASDPQQVIGQRLKSQVLAGRMITPALLEANAVVRRGQSVTLAINSNGVSISMAGKALMDGAIGQRIRVENVNSGRIVEGVVRSPEHVEVFVAAAGGFFHENPKVSATAVDNPG